MSSLTVSWHVPSLPSTSPPFQLLCSHSCPFSFPLSGSLHVLPLHFPASRFLSIPVSLHFPFGPLFRIASMHNIISIIRDDAQCWGCCPVLGTPQKYAFFGAAGRCYKHRLNQSANPSHLIRAGPAQNVCSCSAHGRRHGACGLIPEGKPYRALACGPITSGGRIYTLTRHSRPPGTLPCSFCHFPFL